MFPAYEHTVSGSRSLLLMRAIADHFAPPQKVVIAFLHEALLPAPDTGLRFASPAYNLIGASTVRAQQDDLSPPDILARGVAIPREFRRRRSAGLRVMEIPFRMRPTRMRTVRWESPPDSNVRRYPLS